MSLESTAYDQVIFNPRRLICVPPPSPAGAPVGAAASLAPGAAASKSAVNRKLLSAVQKYLTDTFGGDKPIRPEPLRGWEELDVRIFNLPPPSAGNRRVNSFTIARDLDQQFPGQIAPEYYSLTQQYVQPGEDPEASGTVVGLEIGVAFGGLDERDESTLGRGVRIAVLDTGVDVAAIEAMPVPRQEFDPALDIDALIDVSPSAGSVVSSVTPVLAPAAGHGSFIAGLIHCVAPGATVVSCKVASQMGYASETDIVLGIKRALSYKANIINLSLGGYPFVKSPQWPTLRAFALLEQAIKQIPSEVAIVAAAGNCGSDAPFYPAAFDGVIGVAALDTANRLWEHSNYGDWVQACTRGVDLRSLYVHGQENPVYDLDGSAEIFGAAVNFASWTGTSFAAPLVSAQIAILAAELGMQNQTRVAAGHLLHMSCDLLGGRQCGRRVMVDVPGQT